MYLMHLPKAIRKVTLEFIACYIRCGFSCLHFLGDWLYLARARSGADKIWLEHGVGFQSIEHLSFPSLQYCSRTSFVHEEADNSAQYAYAASPFSKCLPRSKQLATFAKQCVKYCCMETDRCTIKGKSGCGDIVPFQFIISLSSP